MTKKEKRELEIKEKREFEMRCYEHEAQARAAWGWYATCMNDLVAQNQIKEMEIKMRKAGSSSTEVEEAVKNLKKTGLTYYI